MDAADWAHLRPSFQTRRGAIADHWYEAIAHTSFVPRRVAVVRDELRTLTDQVITALLDEPVDRDRAWAIGASLAALHYVHPDALDGTLDVLGRRLMDGLPPDQVQALQPRLMTVLGALAAGFLTRSRAMLLDEQDHIRRALFVSRQQIEAAEEARVMAEAAVRVRTEILNATAHDLARRSRLSLVMPTCCGFAYNATRRRRQSGCWRRRRPSARGRCVSMVWSRSCWTWRVYKRGRS